MGVTDHVQKASETYFSNSVKVLVFAASTLAQLPCGQVILVLGLLLLTRQYAAAEYWLKNWSWSRILADTADPCVSTGREESTWWSVIYLSYLALLAPK